MMKNLLISAALIHLVVSGCPNGFNIPYRGVCTITAVNETSSANNQLLATAKSKCTQYPETIPPIIKEQVDQDFWTRTAVSSVTVLGLECDSKTSLWRWVDGSNITYTPATFDSSLFLPCTSDYGWFINSTGAWQTSNATSARYTNFWCMLQPQQLQLPDDECGDFTDDSVDDTCFQVGVNAESFADAQAICKSFGGNVASIHNPQENSFVRRLAVSRGLINGIYIGARLGNTSMELSWADGTPNDYDNFVKGFPLEGEGDCVAMDTNNSGGQWINLPCSNKAAYACAKRQNTTEPTCGAAVRKEGEIIYSPGFPSDSSTPCDFFLVADAGKRVEVEILLLEANTCCDSLVLSEGTLNDSVLVNLTGLIQSNPKYITASSNIMRVSWRPNGGINVRGMMITFRGV